MAECMVLVSELLDDWEQLHQEALAGDSVETHVYQKVEILESECGFVGCASQQS